jgi:hypothetical protein
MGNFLEPESKTKSKTDSESESNAKVYKDILTAIKLNNEEEVKYILDNNKNFNINYRYYYDNENLLFKAINHYSVNIKLIKILIEAGINVNLINDNGDTPLLILTRNGFLKEVEICELLLENGADPTILDKYNNSSIMNATYSKSDLLELILKYHPSQVNTMTSDKITLLMLCSKNGHYNNVKALLEAGADYTLQDINGMTALMYAVKNKKTKCVEILSLKIFNENDPDRRKHVSLKNKYGSSALKYAIDNYNEACIINNYMEIEIICFLLELNDKMSTDIIIPEKVLIEHKNTKFLSSS